jgi:hypothetical protein
MYAQSGQRSLLTCARACLSEGISTKSKAHKLTKLEEAKLAKAREEEEEMR